MSLFFAFPRLTPALRQSGLAIILAFAAFAGMAHGQERRAVAPSQRSLLIVSELSTYGVEKYGWLYRFMEASGVSLAYRELNSSYGRIYALTGEDATLDYFHRGLNGMAHEEGAEALDVFLHLHGGPGTLWFHDGPHGSAEVGASLREHAALPGKLRLAYSTACYGSSHSQDLLDGGFKVASGSLQVNADSASEYPLLLTAWREGSSFQTAQDWGNEQYAREFADWMARRMGFDDVDSFKVVSGDGGLTIEEMPQ